MTATERVRELLDERGVEYGFVHGYKIFHWDYDGANGKWSVFAKEVDGGIKIIAYGLTPEQAVAATLGQEPDDAAMVKLHDQMNAAMLKYEMAQGIEKRDGDEAIVVPWVAKMHALLEEAAALGSCNCSNKCTNSERTGACLPHFWTHDGTLHVELAKLPESISVRLPDQRDREVSSARTWQYTRDRGTCNITDNGPWGYPYVCSACGASFDPDVNNGEFNYCPNCGRRIEVDDG